VLSGAFSAFGASVRIGWPRPVGLGQERDWRPGRTCRVGDLRNHVELIAHPRSSVRLSAARGRGGRAEKLKLGKQKAEIAGREGWRRTAGCFLLRMRFTPLTRVIGVQVGQGEELVAGLFGAAFHSQPVEQRALGLFVGRR